MLTHSDTSIISIRRPSERDEHFGERAVDFGFYEPLRNLYQHGILVQSRGDRGRCFVSLPMKVLARSLLGTDSSSPLDSR